MVKSVPFLAYLTPSFWHNSLTVKDIDDKTLMLRLDQVNLQLQFNDWCLRFFGKQFLSPDTLTVEGINLQLMVKTDEAGSTW